MQALRATATLRPEAPVSAISLTRSESMPSSWTHGEPQVTGEGWGETKVGTSFLRRYDRLFCLGKPTARNYGSLGCARSSGTHSELHPAYGVVGRHAFTRRARLVI